MGRSCPPSWQRLRKSWSFSREPLLLSEAFGPGVGLLGERPVERFAQLLHRLGQRVVEVLVDAGAEAVAAHVDDAAKAAVLEQLDQLVGLARQQDLRCDRIAPLVELGAQPVPVQRLDSIGQLAHALS